jgi:hypothetical protein
VTPAAALRLLQQLVDELEELLGREVAAETRDLRRSLQRLERKVFSSGG